MHVTKCEQCGYEIDLKTDKCINCGTPIRLRVSGGGLIRKVILIFIVIYIIRAAIKFFSQ